MKDLRLYQIYYNEETRLQLDPGFIPLDNTANERPDWFEFWPIQRLLRESQFDDETWIGVFSPKFKQKTGMRSDEVALAVQSTKADVVSFSPWFAHIALFKNIYVQGEHFHPGFVYLFREFLRRMSFDEGYVDEVMTAKQAIYSNYFVAPFKVWRHWLHLASALFAFAEDQSDTFGLQLNYTTSYAGKTVYPQKIFILERLISFLIQKEKLSVSFLTNLSTCALGAGFENTPDSIQALTLLDEMKETIRQKGSQAMLGDYQQLAHELLTLRDGLSDRMTETVAI